MQNFEWVRELPTPGTLVEGLFMGALGLAALGFVACVAQLGFNWMKGKVGK